MNAVVNPQIVVEREITVHVSEVQHGTSEAEALILSTAATHLQTGNRNPHGLTRADLDVYSQDEVDTLIDQKYTTIDGGTIP